MQEVTVLFERLAAAGVRMTLEQGQLKVHAARGVVTEELKREIAAHKAALVQRLQGQETAASQPGQRIEADPARVREPFPLSDLQLGFYMANDPFMEFHVRPHLYMEFDRPRLDPARYEAAWNRVLLRHRDALCVVTDDVQLQTLAETPQVALKLHDLRHLPLAQAQAALAQLRAALEREELPLDRWPWFSLHVSLWREGPDDCARVHYNHNSFFIDGFGATLLLREVDTCYDNPGHAAAPPALAFRDAVLGLERLAASPAGQVARRYWLDRVDQLPAPPNLPLRAGLKRRCRARLVRRERFLASSDWVRFKTRANAHGVTPSNALTMAYAQVLATWSNSDHFIVSQMVTRRMAELHPDMLEMLGNFVSLYPLEIRIDPDQPFAVNARNLQDQVLRDMQHLHLGGMRVLQELNRRKGAFGSAPSPFVVGSGLLLKGWKHPAYAVLETSQTLIDHQFFELGDGSLHCVWDLLEEFFPEAMIDRMWEAYGRRLAALAGDDLAWHERGAGRPDEGLAPFPPSPCALALPVTDGNLYQALPRKAAVRPDAPALLYTGGKLSYAGLLAWSHAVCRTLLGHGVKVGDRVAILMERGPELLAATFGAAQAGAAFVPVDPKLPAERIAFLVRDTGATVVLVQERFRDLLDWPAGVRACSVAPPDGLTVTEACRANADQLAYVIFTSGSTGRPKGVMIDHRGALNTVLDINQRFGVGHGDTVLGVSAFNFDLSVYDIFGTVEAGARLVYPSPEAALDPDHWLELVLAHDVTIWNSVPALMSLLVEAAGRKHVQLNSLRLVLLSGDKIPLALPDAIRAVAPGAQVVSLGGATEASIWSIVYPIGAIDPTWLTIPYGYAMANQSWQVLDRHGQPCPPWVAGELYIGGTGVALGYWGDEAKTAASFRREGGERRYRTGDLGRFLPNGSIEWMGRNDFQVKIQGHRIELGEIESVLAEHPDVRQAVVVAAGDGARPRLVGHLVLGPDAGGCQQLEAFLQQRLPAYMVPASWRAWDALPLTPNGKVDRSALSRAPLERAQTRQGSAPLAPATALEADLLRIWREVLGERATEGVNVDFFEIGGQSFDAIRIFSRIRERFGSRFGPRLSLSDMWRVRTIRGLAQVLKGRAATGAQHLVPINQAGTGHPLYLVHPAGGSVMGYYPLGQRLARPLFGLQADPVDIAAGLDIPALAAAYVAALRAHQPQGPYSLGGWSTGALIAFEMAAQLEQAGAAVAQLVLLDGPTAHAYPDLDEAQLLTWFFDDLGLNLPVERLRDCRLDGLPLEARLQAAARAVDLASHTAVEAGDALSGAYTTFCHLVRAGGRYTAGRIGADLQVIRVSEDVVGEFADHPHRHDPAWGWGAHTSGRVHSRRVAGNHYSFLRDPQLALWCACLEETGGGVATPNPAR